MTRGNPEDDDRRITYIYIHLHTNPYKFIAMHFSISLKGPLERDPQVDIFFSICLNIRGVPV
jgi:hypothetical protein